MAPRVTAEYKEERRAQILQGALYCFAEKGFQATTIDDIAQYLQVSKGAIYTYFKSKEEIYIELMRERTQHVIAEIKEQFQSIEKAEDKIQFLFRYFRLESYSLMRQYGKVHFEFWIYSSRKQELQLLLEERYEEVVQMMMQVIHQGKKAGEFRYDLDDQMMSQLLWIIRDGISLHYSVMDQEWMYRRIWKIVEDVFISYIRVD
ncbi:TetR/AcrR family transcriptional regulator [Hazenella coriacea]|uniref:TetR family transcriptional regulator n=1 Tax=Hazenella coriacea TaxID=1179467 RepID=A0A4R3L2E2_9BACL|nr:TetR/AcrR family transcriptional regulator [Hazenella coriacea]TCS93065.1 TetR family transcriptional regulator [Hazenella coriacea]